MRDAPRHRTPRRLLRGAVPLAAVAALLAGCATHPAPPISAADLHAARTFKQFTVYWVGKRIDGVPLTAADNLADFNSGVGFALYYGDCLGRGRLHTGGCVLPLKVTTARYEAHSDVLFGPQHWILRHGVPAVVYGGGKDIELYTDQMNVDISAATPALAGAAVDALTPFNRGVDAAFPAFPQPFFRPNPSPAELSALTGASGATGLTGETGETSDISPPALLEPTPSTSS